MESIGKEMVRLIKEEQIHMQIKMVHSRSSGTFPEIGFMNCPQRGRILASGWPRKWELECVPALGRSISRQAVGQPASVQIPADGSKWLRVAADRWIPIEILHHRRHRIPAWAATMRWTILSKAGMVSCGYMAGRGVRGCLILSVDMIHIHKVWVRLCVRPCVQCRH